MKSAYLTHTFFSSLYAHFTPLMTSITDLNVSTNGLVIVSKGLRGSKTLSHSAFKSLFRSCKESFCNSKKIDYQNHWKLISNKTKHIE